MGRNFDRAAVLEVGVVEFWATSDIKGDRLKCNGASYSRTLFPDLFANLVKSGAATFTNGSTSVGMPLHGRAVGDPVKLYTTGGLPTNFTAGTHGLQSAGVSYYIKTVIDANTVTLAATVGGAAITAGSAGTGTHTWVNAPHGDGDGATTFTVPDYRGNFLRGWDDGSGVDASRTIGDVQLDAFASHSHTERFNDSGYAAGSTVASSSSTRMEVNISASQYQTTATGGVETRPRNVSALVTIRYR